MQHQVYLWNWPLTLALWPCPWKFYPASCAAPINASNIRFIYGIDLWPWRCGLDLGSFFQPLVRLLLMLASSACTCLLMVAHRCALLGLFMVWTFDLGTVTVTMEILSPSCAAPIDASLFCLHIITHGGPQGCNAKFIYGFDLSPWCCDLDLGNFFQPLVRLILIICGFYLWSWHCDLHHGSLPLSGDMRVNDYILTNYVIWFYLYSDNLKL